MLFLRRLPDCGTAHQLGTATAVIALTPHFHLIAASGYCPTRILQETMTCSIRASSEIARILLPTDSPVPAVSDCLVPPSRLLGP